MNWRNQTLYREQVADLILLGPDGEDLLVMSDLTADEEGNAKFLVGSPTYELYEVTIQIREIDPSNIQ